MELMLSIEYSKKIYFLRTINKLHSERYLDYNGNIRTLFPKREILTEKLI